MQWIESSCERVEQALPGDRQLLVDQALSESGVAEFGKAVVMADEVNTAFALQLAGKPLTAVEPDLDVERKPGLEPRTEEAEDGVEIVLVDVEALSRPQAQSSCAGVCRAVILKAHAGFEDAQRTDQAASTGCSCSSWRARASLSVFADWR